MKTTKPFGSKFFRKAQKIGIFGGVFVRELFGTHEQTQMQVARVGSFLTKDNENDRETTK